MKLYDAFCIKKGDIVALVGAGGKTSAMFILGEEACKSGLRVVLTTTTKIFLPPVKAGWPVVLWAGPEIISRVGEALEENRVVVAGSGIDRENKILGLKKGLAGRFLEAGADMVVVEADGSAGRPLKAPREGEPVIPPDATLVVPVVGIDCLGRPLSAEHVHRPEIVACLAGLQPGEMVTPRVVAGVLAHPLGYRKGIPPGSRWVPFVNKVETAPELQGAGEIAQMLGKAGAKRVVIGAARASDPVKEVVVF